MGTLSNSLFTNRVLEMDNSRRNMNRILNPSIRYHSAAEDNAPNMATQVQDKMGTNSLGKRGQPGEESGTPQTTAADVGVFQENGLAVKQDVLSREQMKNQYNHETNSNKAGFKLDLTGDGLLNGIILSEVLGKPKYLRKGRR